MPKFYTPPKNGGFHRSPSGHVFTLFDCPAREQKAEDDPASLTDDDLGIIESFHGAAVADQAAAARALAIQATQPAPPRAAPEVAPVETARAAGSFPAALAEVELRKILGKMRTALRMLPSDTDPRRTERAYRTLGLAPWLLTDGDILQLSAVSKDLADSAERARAVGPQDVTEYVKFFIERGDNDLHARQRTRMDWMEKRIVDLEQRLAAVPIPVGLEKLEMRVAELEARPRLKYLGPYEAGRQYSAGDVITHAGSMFVANEATRSTPGTPEQVSRAWTLCVKRGRDGKDAR